MELLTRVGIWLKKVRKSVKSGSPKEGEDRKTVKSERAEVKTELMLLLWRSFSIF